MAIRTFLGIAGLLRDRRGASVVELALLLPFLTLLMVGMIDLSNGVTARFMLSQAVNRTLEMAAGHHFLADKDDDEVQYDFLKTEAADAAGVDTENVTLTTWLECDGVKQADYDGTCPADESIARYLQIRIDTVYSPMFSIGPLGDQGFIPMFAEAAVRIQ